MVCLHPVTPPPPNHLWAFRPYTYVHGQIFVGRSYTEVHKMVEQWETSHQDRRARSYVIMDSWEAVSNDL